MHSGMQKADIRVLHIQKKPCEVSKTVKIQHFIFAVYAFLRVTFSGVKDAWVHQSYQDHRKPTANSLNWVLGPYLPGRVHRNASSNPLSDFACSCYAFVS